MSKEILLPRHMRNKKADKLNKIRDQNTDMRKALKRAYTYIGALEKFIVDQVDPGDLREKDREYYGQLHKKHYPENYPKEVPNEKLN